MTEVDVDTGVANVVRDMNCRFRDRLERKEAAEKIVREIYGVRVFLVLIFVALCGVIGVRFVPIQVEHKHPQGEPTPATNPAKGGSPSTPPPLGAKSANPAPPDKLPDGGQGNLKPGESPPAVAPAPKPETLPLIGANGRTLPPSNPMTQKPTTPPSNPVADCPSNGKPKQ